jgi:peptidyl-prolyl cis-trans isomerase SurA
MKAMAVRALLLGLLLTSTTPCLAAPSKKTQSAPKNSEAPPKEIVIDAIVASVDDKPITLSDLNSRLSPRKLSMAEAGKDAEALKVLDQIILEKLMEEEARTKRLNVADSDVDDYIREVAQRNGLSMSDFESALAKEGRSMTAYKQQIKLDIIKAKLTSSLVRGGVSTTDAEVDEYIASHPELKNAGKNLKLHHIVISKEGRSPEDVRVKLAQTQASLDGGESFAQVAQRVSDTANSPDGSFLGIIPLSDLSPGIAEAVSPLRAGQHSSPMETPNDIQIFFVEERLGAEAEAPEVDEEKLRDEVRQILQKQKTKDRLAAYFNNDLYKNHAVDKRL